MAARVFCADRETRLYLVMDGLLCKKVLIFNSLKGNTSVDLKLLLL